MVKIFLLKWMNVKVTFGRTAFQKCFIVNINFFYINIYCDSEKIPIKLRNTYKLDSSFLSVNFEIYISNYFF